MNIPKSFTLVNFKWTVGLLSEAGMHALANEYHPLPKEDGAPLGLTLHKTKSIFLNVDGHSTREELEHTFLHEVGHALLYTNGVFSTHDEEMVDRIAAFVHQYELTKKGELLDGLASSPAKATRKTRGIKRDGVPRQRRSPNHRGGAQPRYCGHHR